MPRYSNRLHIVYQTRARFNSSIILLDELQIENYLSLISFEPEPALIPQTGRRHSLQHRAELKA